MSPKTFVALSIVAACGGTTMQPSTPALKQTPVAADSAATVPTATPSASSTGSASAGAYDDPEEAGEPHTLEPLFTPKSLPSFPRATVSEADCTKSLEISGDNATKDYATIAKACGAATGAAEYARPASGRLHSEVDKRDTYRVKIAGGLCYRFIGVADGTIQNLDMVITHGNGDVIGEDKTKGPVAILMGDKAWCVDDGDDFVFDVVVNGTGTGHYVFGVWARPKS